MLTRINECSMPTTSMDLQDGSLDNEVKKYDNETAHFIAYSYKRYGG